MPPENPEFRAKVEQLFAVAAFVQDLGVKVDRVEQGVCEASLAITARHCQQDRFVHAGVMATLADHNAGGAAVSLVRPDETVLTVEFKINLLRPAVGERLRCISRVLRPGRTLSVVESEVFACEGERETLVAKAMVTLAIVSANVGTARG